ncbi:MAG: hypothetical protein HOQ12_08400 [Gemmatimonadaceae bacterium]|nr:hypothetical protein [Gemmatimonadaceae bacterium]NUR19537.1 hypothetical protein [Gemmatimonadaceae bacterium]
MSTAVVLTPKTVPTLLASESVKARILPFLPPGTDLDRVIASVQLALTDNPKLGECTPASIVRSIAKIQQWGLEVGYTAHLVQFGQVCTPIADYKGLAQLVRASNAVRHIETRAVYEREHFRIAYGTEAMIEHIPLHRKAERGALAGAYVIFFLPFGQKSFHFMGVDDIDEIRQKHSKQWKTGPVPAWYAMKTVLRQGVKLLPKDPRLAEALKVVAEEEREEAAHVDPDPTVSALAAPVERGEVPTREPGEEDFIDDRDIDEGRG